MSVFDPKRTSRSGDGCAFADLRSQLQGLNSSPKGDPIPPCKSDQVMINRRSLFRCATAIPLAAVSDSLAQAAENQVTSEKANYTIRIVTGSRPPRRSVSRCQRRYSPVPTRSSNNDIFCSAECLLLAQSGHANRSQQCPLSGVKRTLLRLAPMSAFDPKRPSSIA